MDRNGGKTNRRLPRAGGHGNQFGRQRFVDGTQAPGGKPAPSAR
jgi:hypothetical protein